jgi:two-component system LytT family sensor kinase
MQRNKSRYFIEFIIHALFWLGVYYVLQSLNASSLNMVVYNNGKISRGVDARMLFPYPGVALCALIIMFYGNIFWLFKKLIRSKNKTGNVTIIIGWAVLLFTLNYMVIRTKTVSNNANHSLEAALPNSPVKVAFSRKGIPASDSTQASSTHLPLVPPLPPSMTLSTNDWWDMQLVMSLIFLAVEGVAAAYVFTKEWIRNDLARSQAEAHQFSTEIKFLRSQVNPHFLFNTLNNLFSMALKKGDDDVASGISKLSGMMRYMLYESNTEYVALQKEISCLEDCIALNKLRYADREITVHFQHPQPAAVTGIQVAPMLFIPFLENAFKHGVLIGHNSSITISISISQKKLIFTCENTDYSTVRKQAEEQKGIGLENVKRRLQLVYPGEHILHAGPMNGKYNVNLEIDLA